MTYFRGLSCTALLMKSLWLQKDTLFSVTHAHKETTILVLCNVINSQGAGTDSGCENCG